jgi:hypothetical protein
MRCRRLVQGVLLVPAFAASVAGAAGSFQVGTDSGVTATLYRYDEGSQSLGSPTTPFGGFTGGVRVASCDVDGDGTADAIAAAGPGASSQVNVYSGRSGTLLRSFFAFDVGFGGGVFVAGGDVDGDGRCDILVAPDSGGTPNLRVYRGSDNQVIANFYAFNAAFTGGVRVAAADVTGDGLADLIAATGPGVPGEVKVFDAATQQPVRDFLAFPSFSGGIYIAAADLDFDGHADLVVGAGSGAAPTVELFRGTDLGLITSYFAFPSNVTSGVRVGAGDSDGDGIAEIAFATGAGVTTVVKFTYATSPPPDGGSLINAGYSGGAFVAVAPRGDVIFADRFE